MNAQVKEKGVAGEVAKVRRCCQLYLGSINACDFEQIANAQDLHFVG